MNKKYEILEESKIDFRGRRLFRIRATKSFDNVKEGDIGGYLENEKNLNQVGNAWISGNAKISGNAWIGGNAKISGDAEISGNEIIDRKIACLNTEIWTITFGNKIQIGCKRYSIEQWTNFTDEEIAMMDIRALNWWKKWKDIVLSIAKIACFEPVETKKEGE